MRDQDGGVPPNDTEAERAVISACVLDPGAFDIIQGVVLPEHCYSDAHRHILAAIYDLEEHGHALDVVAIRGWLKAHDRLEQVGGATALIQTITAMPAILNVEQHAETVRDKARLRELIRVCQRASAEAYGDCGAAQSFIDETGQQLFDLSVTATASGLVSLLDATHEAIATITAAAHVGASGVTGVASGFGDVDRATTGMHGGELFIVAGRPGMGKTSLVLNMAANIARPRPTGEPSENGVAFFSLEMPREQLASRLLASEARVDVSRLRSGKLRDEDWARITTAAALLGKMPMWLDDTPALTLVSMRSKLRRLQAELSRGKGTTKKLGLVVVDYMQLMQGRRSAGNREQEISELSRGLKHLAKEFGVPVMALSQLNRSVETRSKNDKRPQLSDLRESGAIEQDADTIIFIYRDEYYFKDETMERGIAELIIAKQRNGPTCTLKTRFTDEWARFDNLARDDDYGPDQPPDKPAWAQPTSGGIDDWDDLDAGGRDMRAGKD